MRTLAVEVARVVDDTALATGVPARYGSTFVDAGAFDFWCRRRVSTLGPGGVKLKQPGEVHRDTAIHAPVTATTVSFAPWFVAACAEELGGRVAAPSWRRVVVDDARAEALTRRAARAEAALELESAAAELVVYLLRAHGEARRAAITTTEIARARELLHARLAAPPSLDELAAELGVGKFRLVRSFRAAVGLPPYAYLVHLRISRARELLAAGARPAEVAAEVGFCDQSQLHRHFRRIVGMAPGAYARSH